MVLAGKPDIKNKRFKINRLSAMSGNIMLATSTYEEHIGNTDFSDGLGFR